MISYSKGLLQSFSPYLDYSLLGPLSRADLLPSFSDPKGEIWVQRSWVEFGEFPHNNQDYRHDYKFLSNNHERGTLGYIDPYYGKFEYYGPATQAVLFPGGALSLDRGRLFLWDLTSFFEDPLGDEDEDINPPEPVEIPFKYGTIKSIHRDSGGLIYLLNLVGKLYTIFYEDLNEDPEWIFVPDLPPFRYIRFFRGQSDYLYTIPLEGGRLIYLVAGGYIIHRPYDPLGMSILGAKTYLQDSPPYLKAGVPYLLTTGSWIDTTTRRERVKILQDLPKGRYLGSNGHLYIESEDSDYEDEEPLGEDYLGKLKIFESRHTKYSRYSYLENSEEGEGFLVIALKEPDRVFESSSEEDLFL